MQSSLLRFLARREGEAQTKLKRVSDSHDDSTAPKKRPKLDDSLNQSFSKLKQFARSKDPVTHTAAVSQTAEKEASKDSELTSPHFKCSDDITITEDSSVTCNDLSELTDTNLPTLQPSSPSRITISRASFDQFRARSSQTTPTSCDSSSRITSSGSHATVSSSSNQYTPLEQQFIAIKAQQPDAILFVECGYKYRFFGEDAEVASKVLNIGCFPDHNFKTGSIPVHRLHVHLRRLVAAGYKVGVVKQMETAALKAASDKKSGPFTRELTALYTRTTLIGGDVEGGTHQQAPQMTSERGSISSCEDEELYMMCLCEKTRVKEKGKKMEKNVNIGFLAVQPAAGNMMYDEFQESVASYSELQMRLSHIQPAEILFPRGSSKSLQNMLMEWKKYSGVPGLRFEQLPEEWFDYNKAFSTVTDFYGNSSEDTHRDSKMAEALQVTINLPSMSLCCLGALIHHLKLFKLQRVLTLTNNLKPFSTGSCCMRLNSKTLENLEIFQNQTDKTEKGSLFWVVNHTHTPFGRRMLITWLSYPLRSIKKIRQRQEAVTDLSSNESPSVSLLKDSLCRVPDLERMLCSAYQKKCSPSEFYSLVKALVRIQGELESFTEMALTDLKSELLQQIVKEVPMLLTSVQDFQDTLNSQAARDGNYEDLFAKPEQFPQVSAEKKAIAELKQKLLDCRKLFRKTLCNYSLDYVTVSGTQYLVEVKNKDIKRVPSDWTRVNSTKQVTRFQPPYVSEAVKLLAQHNDQLKISAKAAWDEFLNDFSLQYGKYKRAVDMLATVDCLLSLAKVSKMPGYVCPTISEEQVVDIKAGRHPVIDLLLGEGEQFVPNDTHMKKTELHTMIVTGPNMGGKSSYIKQVALICIMAQIGSYVPATAATLGILDAVHTRMGASDNIHCGKSTFMVELMEASEVIKLATPNSLVILDELGRGTSTHDGTAIAYATLAHFIEHVKCLTLFVTHYSLLAELEEKHPGGQVGNFHMSYVQVDESDVDFEKVVFLYQLEKGVAGGSYGLNVASLAGLKSSILSTAQKKSEELRLTTLHSKTFHNKLTIFKKIFCGQFDRNELEDMLIK